MSEHLSTDQINRFHRRLASPKELLAIDDHISACQECCQHLYKAAQIEPKLIALPEQFQDVGDDIDGEHPIFEQFIAFLENRLDKIDNEIFESHLEDCPYCNAEMRDLRAYRANIQVETIENEQTGSQVVKNISTVNLWQRLIDLWSSPKYWLPVRLATATALVGLSVGLTALPLRHQIDRLERELTSLQQQNRELQQQYQTSQNALSEREKELVQLKQHERPPESKILISLNEGNGTVSLNSDGSLHGLTQLLPDYQEIIRSALTSGRVLLPTEITSLIGKKGSLMGKQSRETDYTLLSPVGTRVQTEFPTFRWMTLPGANSYIVTIYDINFHQISISPPITDTKWTITSPLKHNSIYVWQVTANKEGEKITIPSLSAPEAKFQILDRAKAAEIAQLQKSYRDSHLVLGTISAQMGLLDDAEREFQQLLTANPQSPVVKDLLKNIRAQRQKKSVSP